MQLASAEVRLDDHNSVLRRHISPAEVMVLRRIHGEECLEAIRVEEEVDRSTKEEKARLKARFPRYAGDIEQMFPGLSPQMPAGFEDVAEEFSVVPGVKARPRRKPAADPLELE